MTNTIQTENYRLENMNPQLGTLTSKTEDSTTGFENNYLTLDFGNRRVGDLTTCTFNYNYDPGFEITKTGASCGCTNPSFTNQDGNLQHVVIKYDSSKIANNISKWATLYLKNGKMLKINVVMNK